MFRKKDKTSTKKQSHHLAAQLGFLDSSGIPDLESLNNVEDDGNDEALEAELAALLGGESSPKPKPKPRTTGVAAMPEIDSMVASAMSDTHDDTDNDDVEDDDELLAEFQDLVEDSGPSPAKQASPSPPAPAQIRNDEVELKTDLTSIVAERLENYQAAIANAKANGEDSKVRRFSRGLDQVKAINRKLKSGKKVDPADVPPPVIVGKPPPPKGAEPPKPESSTSISPAAPEAASRVSPAAPQVSPPTPLVPAQLTPPTSQVSPPRPVEDNPTPSAASSSRVAVHQEDTPGPSVRPNLKSDSRYILLSERGNQYMQAAVKAKQQGDLNTAREFLLISKQFDLVVKDFENSGDVDLSDMPPPPPGFGGQTAEQSPSTTEDVSHPKDAMEALQQRLSKYKEAKKKAEAENNSGKARRMGRILKQYEDAIKKEKAGRPIDYEELPAPPGYPPIPTKSSTKSAAQPSGQPAAQPPGQAAAQPPKLKPRTVQQIASQEEAQKPQQGTAKQASPALKPTVVRQLEVLEKRKKEFQLRALTAKKQGDLDEAKRLIKIAKGFDPLIEKSKGGLLVNMATIPDLPTVEDSVETAMECNEEVTGDRGEMFSRLQTSLKRQIQICETNRKQFSKMGKISEVEKFEQMARSSRQDLDTLVGAHTHGDPIPRFHYEYRTLPSLKLCADLSESQAEVVIVRGVQYTPPSGYAAKDLDTYIKFEFPFPTDEPPSEKTHSKEGDNPEYEQSFKFPVNLSSRSFAGVVKRKSVKFEVYYKKGFLRSDGVFGTASLKLTDFEKKCEIHESLQLTEGRKQVGGKLEVKVRIYRPLSGIKHEFVREKWLVIDGSSKITTQMASSRSPSKSRTQQNSAPRDSVAVLKWTTDALEEKLSAMKAKRMVVPKEILAKHESMKRNLAQGQNILRQADSSLRQEYVQNLQQLLVTYHTEAKQALQSGNKDKAKQFMSKKNIVEKEIQSLR
ncbi:coiled-coil and C2 domain-containing protein 1-like [Antedon mediterranea]|uniref:coiled-coil and C2 domain-containing protein 1-like n=1 Tax=Antedon mediterranea TaxID=105859 RepID=UPI003AF7B49F